MKISNRQKAAAVLAGVLTAGTGIAADEQNTESNLDFRFSTSYEDTINPSNEEGDVSGQRIDLGFIFRKNGSCFNAIELGRNTASGGHSDLSFSRECEVTGHFNAIGGISNPAPFNDLDVDWFAGLKLVQDRETGGLFAQIAATDDGAAIEIGAQF